MIIMNKIHVSRPNLDIRKVIGLIAFFSILVGSIITFGSYRADIDNHTTRKSDSSTVALPAVGSNVRIYLLECNQSYTITGESFSFSGYTQKFDGAGSSGPGFYNTSNIPVYPIIDDVHFDGLDGRENRSIRSGVDGYFEFSVEVAEDRPYHQDFNVWANITEIVSEGIIVDLNTVKNESGTGLPLYHDVVVNSNIAISSTDISEPVLVGDEYDITLNVTYLLNGTGILTNNISVYQNNRSTELYDYNLTNTNANGIATITFTQINDLDQIIFGFTGNGLKVDDEGNPYYQVLPSYVNFTVSRVTKVNSALSFSNVENNTLSYVFPGGIVAINGTLWANDNQSSLLANRAFNIALADGTIVHEGITDVNGEFTVELDLLDLGYNETDPISFYVSIDNLDEALDLSESETVSDIEILIGEPIPPYVAPPSHIDWTKIILPGLGAIVIIVGIVLFQRFRMQNQVNQEFKLRKVDFSRFTVINLLYNQGRKREAIAYTYKIFADLINEKYGLIREPQQTLREYGIECVTRYGLDPLRTYPFIGMVENIIYGAFDLNQRSFQKAITIFGRIFQEITGTSLDFTLEMSTEDQQEVTLKIGAVN